MQEIWKDIPGYEGFYQASNIGRIRSVDRLAPNKKYGENGKRRWKGVVLKAKRTADNCDRVTLWKCGKGKDWLTYRLVAMAFLGMPPNEKYTINHKDGNRLNNKVENLEWMTLADNIRHGYENGLYPKKEIALKRGGEVFNFSSYTEASTFLGRNKGYICICLKNSRAIKDKDGLLYEVVNAW